MKQGFQGRWKRQSLSVVIGIGVIVCVLLLNVLFSVLTSRNRWFIDLTAGHYEGKRQVEYGGLYTLSDQAEILLGQTIQKAEANLGGEKAMVDIIFCAEPDMLCSNFYMRQVYYTALALEKEYPENIRVSYTDVWKNPSSVDAYRATSYSSIYQTNVIVTSGSEFRVYNQRAFFIYDESTSSSPWAYSGEKTFIKGIMAVTKAESPIVCLTTNHGEPFGDPAQAERYSRFVEVLENAGYVVRYLDLYREEIPADCRLIITMDPKTDFYTDFQNAQAVSEIKKLEEHLNRAYSFMVLANADTPVLTNLEEFLEEWGVVLNRYEDENGNLLPGTVADPMAALDGMGLTFAGSYESEGAGGGVSQDLRQNGGSPTMVFSNAIGISVAPTYETAYVMADAEAGTGAYTYGSYSRNRISRSIFDIMRAGEASLVLPAGDPNGTPLDTRGSYKLITMTCQDRYIGEGQGYTQINDISYVCAIGSTDFVANEVLASNAYGNTDLLLSVLRTIGREIEPVGLNFKPYYEEGIALTEGYPFNPVTVVVVLAVLPAVICIVAGTVILVKRRFRT